MVLLDLSPKEGKFEELVEALKGTLPNTRSYDGCLDLKMCVYEDENKVCLVEEWEIKNISKLTLHGEKVQAYLELY